MNLVKSKRKGITLIELLGVMVVMAILMAIAISGVMAAQRRAREVKALSALEGYHSAFLSAAETHPSIFGDRIEQWGTDGSTYKSKAAFERTVTFMNATLDVELKMSWDDTTKLWTSNETDPWGGHYVLMEYPTSSSSPDTNYYDCSAGENGYDVFAFSIWCTGNNDYILSSSPYIVDEIYGIGITFSEGVVKETYHGFNELYPFTGYNIPLAQ